eukprot:scaffold26007_cov79-Isochrysis_galbana.AAC.2
MPGCAAEGMAPPRSDAAGRVRAAAGGARGWRAPNTTGLPSSVPVVKLKHSPRLYSIWSVTHARSRAISVGIAERMPIRATAAGAMTKCSC